jgi:hypothetical protein
LGCGCCNYTGVIMATITRVLTTTGAFVLPGDFPSGGTLQVECIGAGFGNGTGGGSGNFGGGGGAYSKTNAITGLAAGNTVYIQAGDAGTDSWFNKAANSAPANTTNGCLAKAGAGGITTALGGSAALSIGDTKYSGGNGGSYSVGCPYDEWGGVGGAAGPNGAGANGVFYATGGRGGGGANGGSAGSGNTGGNNRFGTGGGTSGNNGTNGGGGGKGAGGAPELIWTDSISLVQWGPCGGSGGGDGSGSNPTGLGGGGACRTVDINTAASQKGIVVLTYTTSSNNSNFFQFF